MIKPMLTKVRVLIIDDILVNGWMLIVALTFFLANQLIDRFSSLESRLKILDVIGVIAAT